MSGAVGGRNPHGIGLVPCSERDHAHSIGAADKAEFAAAGEVEGRELLEECKAKERDGTWGSKWHRWATKMGINGEMDMSTQPLKLEVCNNLKTFMRAIRKCSASPSANPSEIYYPPKSYAGCYWALGRLYREQYFERWGNTDEKDRPPMVECSKDRDLSLIMKLVIAAEMQTVIEKLGNSIHDNEVETLPIDTADRFFNPSAGIMNHITGEGVNNLLAWQNLLLHGVRGYSSLHQLEYPSSYDLKFDPMLNMDTITLSEYESNKTFKPSVECPSAKRERWDSWRWASARLPFCGRSSRPPSRRRRRRPPRGTSRWPRGRRRRTDRG